MTRETKLGLAVASSFLSLVGGVLGVKLYRGEGPAAAPPEAVAKAEPPKSSEPTAENPAVNNVPDVTKEHAQANADRQALPATPKAEPVVVQPVAVDPPPPNADALAMQTAPAAPVVPAPAAPAPAMPEPATPTPAPVAPLKPDADAVSLTKSETQPDAKKPDAAPVVAVPAAVPAPNANAAPAPIVMPPPATPAPEPKIEAPPAPVVPTIQPPAALPPAPATPEPKKEEPKKEEPKKEELPAPAPTALPPVPAPLKKDDPPAPAPTALPPAPATPEPATPEPKKEEPPPQKFNFDKPANNGGITLPPPPPSSPPTATPPAPLSPDINKKAEPTVTVVPATVPTSLGAPASKPGDPFVAAPARPAPLPKTQSYLEEEHRWQPGDSFRAVSERYYAGSPKYEAALRAYNRDYPLASKAMKQNAAALPPGTTVWVPPVRILERDYPGQIADVPLASGVTTAQPASRLVSPAPPPPPATPVYKAHGGETLYEMARRTLGSSDQWYQIYRMNPTLSNDPKLPIAAGTLLRMPTNAKIDPADKP